MKVKIPAIMGRSDAAEYVILMLRAYEDVYLDLNDIEVKTEKLTSGMRSYKPPRFTTATKTTKQQKIFEMTWTGAHHGGGYTGYTCIEPWEADSLQELYEYMQQYLKDLMLEINKPVVECQHCNGLGCITNTIGTNER